MSQSSENPQSKLWLLLLLPGVYQLVLLCSAMFPRLAYPYDLEWMEGGVLAHAQRIADGAGIYVEPSVDFIPFLYTPLYPGIMAMFNELFGISYAVGRGISVLATLGICVLLVAMVKRESAGRQGPLGWAGGFCALGFFAATYPWVEGWYDLVRADSLFMLMVLGGLFGIRAWARDGGQEGLAKVACASALLGLSFFAKQTGVLFVVTGGLMLLVLNWRRVPVYVAVTGAIGLGGTWLFNKVTGGWFWVYIYETHQHHDFNMDRFYASFGNMLWHFPAMTMVIVISVIALLATALIRRRLPASARAFGLWLPVFLIALLVGALGWGTQFAHFNAYMPAMLFGALCAGLSVPSTAACVQLLLARSPATSKTRSQLVGAALALALGAQLVSASWSPGQFVPSDADEEAGHELIRTIRAVEGDVLIPYHPWYAKLAGKELRVHLMGLRDMSTGKVWPIRGLRESIAEQRFAAIIMDNRPLGAELAAMHRHYRMDDDLPDSASPHVYTGAGAVWNKKVTTLVPRSIWVPSRPLPLPPGTRVLWDFETGGFSDWRLGGRGKKKRNSIAWGKAPVTRALPKQGPVRRYGGRYYLSSFHGGDASTGTLHSPPFTIDGSTISFRLSGGNSNKLRAELRIDGEVIRSATGTNSERMEEISWNVAAYAGTTAELVLIDDDKGSWGHLNADEFWISE